MIKAIRLTDLQLVLLSNAAARDTGSLLPLPETCTQDASRISKAVAALLKRGFIEEQPVTDLMLRWREDGDNAIGLFITDAGRNAIGAGGMAAEAEAAPADPTAAASPAAAAELEHRANTKIAVVIALLEREDGATLDELVGATDWLPHTTRAALTGLRKRGRTIDKSKRGDTTCYRIAVEQPA